MLTRNTLIKSRTRRQQLDEDPHSDRWLISYADLITLLFAFFVVMYSTASINEGKMRVLSDSLVASFSGRNKTLAPIQIGKLVRSPHSDDASPATTAEELVLIRATRSLPFGQPLDTGQAPQRTDDASTAEPREGNGVGARALQSSSALAAVDDIANQVESALHELINMQAVAVSRNSSWIEIAINTNFLFVSGSARLANDSLPILQRLAEVLRGFANPVQVEGFTDDRPISTPVFPSNWELSAARAASVVHLFMKMGVQPERMVAIGYGDHRPVADYDTEAGRNRNRRVVIVIPANEGVRRLLETERRLGLYHSDDEFEY